MEYIYKKIIYSPEFNKMSGRYDNDNLKDKIEKQKENHIKQKKEKESKIHLKKLEKMRKSIIMPKKESDLNYDEIDNLMNIVKRHNSLVERRNSSMISILKRPSQDKEGNDNNKNNNDESKIIDKKFFKRMHSMIYEGTHSFGLINHNNNKNSLESIKNIEEDEKEEHYDIFEKKKISNNNMDGNTLSSINPNKITSGKKKDSSVNYNNNETDIIYPSNVSKNDSNIFINKNISYKKLKNGETKNKNNKSNSFYKERPKRQKLYSIVRKSRNNSNIRNKQNKLPSLSNKVVNFEKMLSRAYVRKLNERKYNIYSSLSPNYESIRPKCIMKVIYGQKHYKKNRKAEFKSSFNEFIFDENKYFNNYNNHIPPKNVYLGKTTGRELDNNSSLPSYMVNQYNRNAFNTFNDKSLKMNNFSNGNLKVIKSSFNDKKSFNYKLNEQYFENDNDNIAEEINLIMKKIKKPLINNKNEYGKVKSLSCSNMLYNKKYKIYGYNSLFSSKMPEYYKFNLDNLGKYP